MVPTPMSDAREDSYIRSQQNIEHLLASLVDTSMRIVNLKLKNKKKILGIDTLLDHIDKVIFDLDAQKKTNFTQYCQYDLMATNPTDVVIENLVLKSQIEDLEADIKKWTLDMTTPVNKEKLICYCDYLAYGWNNDVLSDTSTGACNDCKNMHPDKAREVSMEKDYAQWSKNDEIDERQPSMLSGFEFY